MKAVNLYLLTRTMDQEALSLSYQALSERYDHKEISPHEAASLQSLTNLLAAHFMQEDPGMEQRVLSCLDGFFFSYTIAHIGKEFDLLKISANGDCIVNIELKSEEIEEERIRKQLEQNRYYLTHIAHSIYSYTYVMETGLFYCLNDRGHFRQCGIGELAAALERPALAPCLTDGIDRFFRASDYLISPVASPDKFLQGQYFLTNQQFDFRKKILSLLKQKKKQVISVYGNAGTGKTLLLFDLAMQLSKKEPVLFVHAGPLRKGHLVLNQRLRKVTIRSGSGPVSEDALSGYTCLLIDEADHLSAPLLQKWLDLAAAGDIPVIIACDPHHLLEERRQEASDSETISLIAGSSTLSLTLSGNIRINRPVYSFLHTLLYLKDCSAHADYSCIDVLYANDTDELRMMSGYYGRLGYTRLSAGRGQKNNAAVIAQEYDRVLMILDQTWYYDETQHLRVRSDSDVPLALLYEGLSRTREKLCLVILSNRTLFSQVLAIRLHRLAKENE